MSSVDQNVAGFEFCLGSQMNPTSNYLSFRLTAQRHELAGNGRYSWEDGSLQLAGKIPSACPTSPRRSFPGCLSQSLRQGLHVWLTAPAFPRYFTQGPAGVVFLLAILAPLGPVQKTGINPGRRYVMPLIPMPAGRDAGRACGNPNGTGGAGHVSRRRSAPLCTPARIAFGVPLQVSVVEHVPSPFAAPGSDSAERVAAYAPRL